MLKQLLQIYTFKELMIKACDEYIWGILKHLPGISGVYIRYFYVKIMAKKVDGFVIIQRGVHLTNSFGLELGKNTYINRGCFIDAYGGIKLENEVLLGPNVTLVTNNHNAFLRGPDSCYKSSNKSPIQIGCGTVLFGNSFVNPGVIIGDKCVVCVGTDIAVNISNNTKVTSNKLYSYSEAMKHNVRFSLQS